MSRYTFFVVAAVAVALALANEDVSLDLEANANLTDAAKSFSFRFTTAGKTSVGFLIDQCNLFMPGHCDFPKEIYTWWSTSIKAELASVASNDVDSMVALAFPPAENTFPFSIFAYAKGKAALSVTPVAYLTNLLTVNGTASFKGGAVAMAALTLMEVTPDGVPNLKSVITLNSGECSPKELDGSSKATNGMSCVMNLKDSQSNHCKVTVTYVTSKRAGILKYGQTPVSPRSIDMIIEVEGFHLSDPKNHARLSLGFATVSGELEEESHAEFIEKDGERIYVAASSHVVVDDKVADVNVKITSGSAPSGVEKAFKDIVGLALGTNFDLRIANVDFPEGVTDFVYDPACGAGSTIYAAGASTVALSLLVVLVCALLFLF